MEEMLLPEFRRPSQDGITVIQCRSNAIM